MSTDTTPTTAMNATINELVTGLSIRIAAVRELHQSVLYGGLLLCAGCSTNCGNVLWPCPTTKALDGTTP